MKKSHLTSREESFWMMRFLLLLVKINFTTKVFIIEKQSENTLWVQSFELKCAHLFQTIFLTFSAEDCTETDSVSAIPLKAWSVTAAEEGHLPQMTHQKLKSVHGLLAGTAWLSLLDGWHYNHKLLYLFHVLTCSGWCSQISGDERLHHSSQNDRLGSWGWSLGHEYSSSFPSLYNVSPLFARHVLAKLVPTLCSMLFGQSYDIILNEVVMWYTSLNKNKDLPFNYFTQKK